jgi:CDP-glucose 4,6-dehydratase
LQVRNPTATRPWQHVLEPLAGYLCLAEHLWRVPSFADSFNFGPYSHEAVSVQEILDIANDIFNVNKVQSLISSVPMQESKSLTLDTSKTQHLLGFYPRWSMNKTIAKTLEWYFEYYSGSDSSALCNDDIDSFESI